MNKAFELPAEVVVTPQIGETVATAVNRVKEQIMLEKEFSNGDVDVIDLKFKIKNIYTNASNEPSYRYLISPIKKGEERTSKGERYNTGKVRMDLVPYDAVLAMADVLTFGANKYAERNWEKGMDYSVPFACLQRHLIAFWQGEDNDKESGLSHLAHVLCNAAMLYRFSQMEGLDDRPKQKDK